MDRSVAFGTCRIDRIEHATPRRALTPVIIVLALVTLAVGAVLTTDAIALSLQDLDAFGLDTLAGTL